MGTISNNLGTVTTNYYLINSNGVSGVVYTNAGSSAVIASNYGVVGSNESVGTVVDNYMIISVNTAAGDDCSRVIYGHAAGAGCELRLLCDQGECDERAGVCAIEHSDGASDDTCVMIYFYERHLSLSEIILALA